MTQPSQQPAAGDASSSAAGSSVPGAPAAPAAPEVPDTAADSLRRSLMVGGVLLIVNGLASFATPSGFMMGTPLPGILFWTATIAFSAAVLVFAFGVGRGGSLVARRPLGIAAALVLALSPFAERVLTLVYPFDATSNEFYMVWGYVSAAVKVGAAVVLVVQIARAGVVTGRVRWAPTWALAVIVVPQVLALLLATALSIDQNRVENDGLILLSGLGMLASFVAPVTLGILAIVRAQRTTPRAVPPTQVYPPVA